MACRDALRDALKDARDLDVTETKKPRQGGASEGGEEAAGVAYLATTLTISSTLFE